MAMWSDDDEHGAPIDAAIDDAARQMTAGAPGGDFRARVLARLGEREPFSGSRRIAWTLAPIAAAIIIVLLVAGRFGGRGDRRIDNSTTSPQSTRNVQPQPQRQPPAEVSAAQSQTRQTSTSVRLKPDTTYTRDGIRRTAGGRRAPSVAPAEADALVPPPLDVESIRLAALPAADSIGVAPLETIEPIDVAPLAAPEIDEPQRRER
jgi:hypothetical protein